MKGLTATPLNLEDRASQMHNQWNYSLEGCFSQLRQIRAIDDHIWPWPMWTVSKQKARYKQFFTRNRITDCLMTICNKKDHK